MSRAAQISVEGTSVQRSPAGGAPVRLAVLGAGTIGRRHIGHIQAQDCCTLLAVVDPSPEAEQFADRLGARWYPSLDALLAAGQPPRMPDGIIVATPNRMHVAQGLQCLEAGIPVLVEKPLADDVADATSLVEAAERAGVALLTGHHRRHNPLVHAARQSIDDGCIGTVVAVHASCWFYKPAAYFEPAWRRQAGAGPVLTNLIHDVDLLRYLCGEVVSVQAMDSNAQRGHAVEETAVALLRFASGALGTMTVSDTIVSPWSWEFTSGENPAYTRTDESCLMVGGTRGSLTIPHLDLWRHTTKPDWWEPLARERRPADADDPLAVQIRNFCGVIRGTEQPKVSGREGLATLKVIAAINRAAETGGLVDVG